MPVVPIRHFHLFCGLGGGAKGFNRGTARVGNLTAQMECIGGIDIDPVAIQNFERLAGVPGTVLDLFSRDQYVAFHGHQPPPEWREATPIDIQRAAGFKKPNCCFLSSPCKGFSGLLAESQSKTRKYQALNELTVRGIMLMLEAWSDDPPELIIFENVPRISSRGRHLLDIISAVLRDAGYVVAETTHNCGEIGGLAQSRKRFLLVARHAVKVPPFLYEPPKRSMRGVGEILEKLPLPGDTERGGPMHRIPELQWQTWVRLAFVEPGKDWRSLNRLRVGSDGNLLDYAIVPEMRAGVLGVNAWDQPAALIAGRNTPTNGKYSVADPRHEGPEKHSNEYRIIPWGDNANAVTSAHGSGQCVADPRIDGHEKSVQLGIREWHKPSGVITGNMAAGAGPNSVADPRPAQSDTYKKTKYRVTKRDEPVGAVISASGTGNGAFAVCEPTDNPQGSFHHSLRVTSWNKPAGAVTTSRSPGSGASTVADPRYPEGFGEHANKMRVVDPAAPAPTITGSDRVGSGALSVSDPRPSCLFRPDREGYSTQGHYGVCQWEEHSNAIPAYAKYDRGKWAVADPRTLPLAKDRLICRIITEQGNWHRPLTTTELAALQSLIDPEDLITLCGKSDAQWREQIGNAVPPDAATAIASVMAQTLLLAWSGESFLLSAQPIWVQPLAVSLAVDVPDLDAQLQ